MPDLWRLEDLRLDTAGVRRLGPLTLVLRDGVTALTGPSGGGKTSLLNLLAGFERPSSGVLSRLFSTTAPRPPVFWAPVGDALWPHLRVEQHLTAAGANRPDELLDGFGLLALRHRHPDDLSRGERNRLALARVVASNARVWLLDEPLAHAPRAQALELWPWLLARARAQGAAVVAATHAPELAEQAEHRLELRDGQARPG